MQRKAQIESWLLNELNLPEFELQPASSDASFRRYFRVFPLNQSPISGDDNTLIVMDAPPDKEDTGPFVKVATLMADIGLNVPLIKHSNLEKGFLLLSDLGSKQYLSALNKTNVDELYGDALQALLTLQAKGPKDNELPAYDYPLLMREMELFREWYLKTHLQLTLSSEEEQMLSDIFERLAESALAQPRVCVHRDYHSRNLMLTAANNPGILDFQDAVIGPITYDLVSLLRDCYIAWPKKQVESWALSYLQQAADAGVIKERDEAQLLQWFDWMGVQRHLKATGIFARLNHRDGKPGYLQDIPRTLSYVVDVCSRYKELQALNDFLHQRVDETIE
ncbi:aminoglycoside phosphotransferase family protein [Kaarinaea lacus]